MSPRIDDDRVPFDWIEERRFALGVLVGVLAGSLVWAMLIGLIVWAAT